MKKFVALLYRNYDGFELRSICFCSCSLLIVNKAKDICSKKQIFCILFVLAIIINCGIILTLRDMHNQDENKIEILILADRGIRISAPRDVLITYLEAYSRGEDPAILKKILDSIISNPESIVEEIPGEEDVVNDKTVQIEP